MRRDEGAGGEGAHEGRVGGEQRGHELQHREGELGPEDRAPEDGELEHRHHLRSQPRPSAAAAAAAATAATTGRVVVWRGGGRRRWRARRR